MTTLRRLSLPIDFFVLLFAISGILGLLPAYDRSLGYGVLLAVLLSAALYFVVAYFVRSFEFARNIGLFLLLVGVCFALLFIGQYGHQGYIEVPGFVDRLGHMTTVLPEVSSYDMHPNAAATFLEGLIPLGIVLAFTSRERIQQIVCALGILVISYALLLTFSRGAMVALAATLLIFLVTRLPRLYALVVGLVIVVVGVILLLFLPHNLPMIGESLDWVMDRLLLYRNSAYVASDYAFTGIGLGDTFTLVYSRFGLLIQVPFLSYTHNLPLAAWTNQGLLGLIAFCGMVVTFYLFVYRVNRSSTPRRLFHGMWLAATTTLLHGLFDARQYVEGWWMMGMMFLWIGLAVALGRSSLQKAFWVSREVTLTYVPRRMTAAGVVVALALTVIFHRPLVAAWNTNIGALTETRGELMSHLTDDQRILHFLSAEGWYQNALDTEPNLSNANRRLGNLEVKLERFEKAVPLLEAAYAREPTNPATVKGLGLSYVWVGETEKAAEVLSQLENITDMKNELYTWGHYRTEQGKTLMAAYAWETAQLLYPDPTNLDVLMLIGNTFLSVGRSADAQRWYEQVLEYDPNYEAAQVALQFLS